ncbi:MAG: class II glutamine amidotransferase [Nanoarchaeota archaeon]|nr:class II glutamine amidotransferase [Nanoarchaeota archaeon]
MSCEAKHECGVAAVSLKDSDKALFYLYKILLNLQNRGQLSAGVTTFNPQRPQLINTYRNIGTVNEVFRTSNKDKSMDIFRRYSGTKGIGHVRYATCGANDRSYAQPFERHHGRKWKWYSFCFNGNLANYSELKEELIKKKDYHMTLDNDTEVIMHYISKELIGETKPSMSGVFSNLAKKFDGSYNIAFINGYGDIIVTRDPIGNRPLVYSIEDGNLLVASESNALVNCGAHNFKSLEPGKMIEVNNGNVEIKQFAKPQKTAHCMF